MSVLLSSKYIFNDQILDETRSGEGVPIYDTTSHRESVFTLRHKLHSHLYSKLERVEGNGESVTPYDSGEESPVVTLYFSSLFV